MGMIHHALKKHDAQPREEDMNANTRLNRLFKHPDKEDILHFLRTDNPEELESLYRRADEVRKEFVGDAIHLRAIIEFSNYCRRGCIYCGINKDCLETTRYRIPPAEIIEIAGQAIAKGYRTIVLQSGEDPHYTASDYETIIRGIKSHGDVAITLACGEKSEEEYRAYFKAGAERYLLKHETSDPDLYHRLNPGMSYENRIHCLRTLKKIGFQSGSGIMIGLPGQTFESIAGDILLFKELDIDMIGAGPFIAHPATGIKENEMDREDITYRVLALNRIVTRSTHLPATTALSTINETDARKIALRRGANVIMPNETPQKYRRYYEIYPNKKRIEVSDTDFRRELRELAGSLGRFISDSHGHRGEKPR